MKSIFKSKTFWANAFAFITGAAMLSNNPNVSGAATVLSDPALQAQAALLIQGIVGIVLRFKTSEKVEL